MSSTRRSGAATRALIIGGGIAGPVVAMALRRAGIDATVFEAYAAGGADVGSYLTVASNGVDALRAIDADGAVIDAGFSTSHIVLRSGTGKLLGRVAIGATRPGVPPSLTIKRASLHRALHGEAVQRGVAVQFGKRLVAGATTARGVVAQFADGTEAEGDVLIGCDGVHSVTRQLIDPAAPSPRYVGLLNFGGYTPYREGSAGEWHMVFGKRAFFGHAVDGNGGTVWFANVPGHAVSPQQRAARSMDEWKRWLLEFFRADEGPAASLIAAGRLELAADNTHDLPCVPTWHRGPLIIVGDAAHAPSPSSGQGASMAIEDAIVLAKCLRDGSNAAHAFAMFEGLRRRRVERIVAQGARNSSSKIAGPVARGLRDWLMPVALKYFVTERSLAWMYEHHIAW
jgi:2-polyprenyl-6-methoxyphenol hydroxylase-like FAD-dependent oxidoreductase